MMLMKRGVSQGSLVLCALLCYIDYSLVKAFGCNTAISGLQMKYLLSVSAFCWLLLFCSK